MVRSLPQPHCCKTMWNSTQQSMITTDIYTSF